MKARFFDESIAQNLKDAGCDKEVIDAFMHDLQEGNKAKATQLIQKHRCSLLADLHKDQKRIDCLDYLIFMIQRANNHVQN